MGRKRKIKIAKISTGYGTGDGLILKYNPIN